MSKLCHLEILKEICKEGETNPEPWKAFEILIGEKLEWVECNDLFISYFSYKDISFRRKQVIKKAIYQWVIQYLECKTFAITPSHTKFSCEEEVKKYYTENGVNINIIAPILESRENRIDD